jgi:predicted porin
MNKKLLAVAVVGALASPLAFAQNVTLYGGIDVGLQRSDQGQQGAKNFVASGQWYTSRVGFKASDDIGPGLSAVLVAESGITADTGGTDSAGFWQRQVYGGLDSKQWGALTIGRQYTHMHNQSAGTGSLLATTGAGTLSFSGHLVRASNAVKYSSANYGGFNFGALYGFGENINTSESDGRYWEAHVGYAMKPFAVDFATARTKTDNGTIEGNVKRNQLVGKWDSGAFAVAAGFANDKTDGDLPDAEQRVWWIQPGFRFGGNNEIYAAYSARKDKVNDDNETKVFGVSYRHLFTKRTYAYASWAKQSIDGTFIGPNLFANQITTAPAAGEDRNMIQVGLAQEF